MIIENILKRPWKELKELQDRKLRHFIRNRMYPFSPYYRALFDKNKIDPEEIRSVADLSKIPFTSKKTFIDISQENPSQGNLAFLLQPDREVMKKFLPKKELLRFLGLKALKGQNHLKSLLEKEYRPIFLTATAGTTELPIPFLYTSYDIENLKVYGKRIIEILGIQKDQKFVNVFPYAPHLAFWLTVFAGLAGGIFMLSTGGGKTVGTEGNIRTLVKIKPQFLIGVPSFVYHLLKTASEQNHKLNFLNQIVLGAARVPTGFKRKLSALLQEMGASDVRIMGTYGFTESRSAWVECPTNIEISSGYHTYPDKEVFEVIDPETGQVKGEGEDGELVYSNLDARGTCVLRYRTGDLVRGGILYSACPHCGRTVPRIASDIVRASNMKNVQVSKIKDTLVNLNNLEYLLEDKEEIDDWQIEITKKDQDPYEVDQLILYVSLLDSIDRAKFAARLNQEVLAQAEISFNQINFVSSKEIKERTEIESAVKAKKIIDKRPKT